MLIKETAVLSLRGPGAGSLTELTRAFASGAKDPVSIYVNRIMFRGKDPAERAEGESSGRDASVRGDGVAEDVKSAAHAGRKEAQRAGSSAEAKAAARKEPAPEGIGARGSSSSVVRKAQPAAVLTDTACSRLDTSMYGTAEPDPIARYVLSRMRAGC